MGATAESTDVRYMLERTCHELKARFMLLANVETDLGLLRLQLLDFLQQSAERARRIVLIIDAVNQMDSTGCAHTMVRRSGGGGARATRALMSLTSLSPIIVRLFRTGYRSRYPPTFVSSSAPCPTRAWRICAAWTVPCGRRSCTSHRWCVRGVRGP